MHKTSAETEERKAALLTVEMDDRVTNVEVYAREATGCTITGEASIDLTPEAFEALVSPILKAAGYTIIATPEGF